MDIWGKRISERGNRNEKALRWCEFQDSKSPSRCQYSEGTQLEQGRLEEVRRARNLSVRHFRIRKTIQTENLPMLK